MKTILKTSILLAVIGLSISCKKEETSIENPTYSNEVAVQWINLQQKLVKTTAGFGPGPAGRFYAYSGVTMYEALLPSLPLNQSISSQVGGISSLPLASSTLTYYGPASVNAALAQCSKSFFSATSVANKASIDSLEAVFNTKYKLETDATSYQNSIDFGKQAATAIFEWAKTDGALGTYPAYVAPVGVGMWVPTAPAFGAAINPYGGTFRPFLAGVSSVTFPAPPFAYSENSTSDFYKMVNEVYTISQSLTADQKTIATTWGDIAGNFNGPSHFTNVVTQLVQNDKLPLDEAAILYAKHGMAINDAAIIVFKAKYQYNQVRPITYIQNVLGQKTWSTVIPTPAHPEYLSAHAVIAQAVADVLKVKFGNIKTFTDNTHLNLYGARTYNTFDDYAQEAGISRVYAGIHFKNTATASYPVGAKVGALVNNIKFTK
jgi:hypothetical protein